MDHPIRYVSSAEGIHYSLHVEQQRREDSKREYIILSIREAKKRRLKVIKNSSKGIKH